MHTYITLKLQQECTIPHHLVIDRVLFVDVTTTSNDHLLDDLPAVHIGYISP